MRHNERTRARILTLLTQFYNGWGPEYSDKSWLERLRPLDRPMIGLYSYSLIYGRNIFVLTCRLFYQQKCFSYSRVLYFKTGKKFSYRNECEKT